MVAKSRQINGDILQNLRCETSRTFRKKKREYLKHKINELETNYKRKISELYGSLNEFRKGYQPRVNISKDKNHYLLMNPHRILNKW